MHHDFPDIIQDDVWTLTYEGNIYKCRKGTWADKDHFVKCHDDEPLDIVQERKCQSLVDWNILTPIETEIKPGDREVWGVFSKNDELFGSLAYTCYQYEGFTGQFEITDLYIGILPEYRGQGLMKFMAIMSDWMGRNGGLDLQKVEYSAIDTSNQVLKNAVNRKAEHLGVEKKFERTSHRFNMNETGIWEYWAEKGIKNEMFSLTRGTSQITDSKWATTLVQMHLEETVAWNDPSRFS